ncbi:hypothetical protein BC940DRAFT_335641 [Gongronella butleri]|nr:hypothetical protein BC940DRAFT_335641 [Gongronella butleri]
MPPTNDDPALLHLFSPTALSMDLSYVDKTYYDPPMSRSASRKSMEVSQHSLHSVLFNRALSLLTSMSRLDLHSLNLLVLPSQISRLSHLTQLDLSHNHLAALPASIQHLKHLRHLNLSHNRLTALPPVVSRLTKLVTLNLSHNPALSIITPTLANALRLAILDVSHTNIDALPAELACLLTIRIDQCPRMAKNIQGFDASLQHDPPSLVEICARHIIRTPIYRATVKRKHELAVAAARTDSNKKRSGTAMIFGGAASAASSAYTHLASVRRRVNGTPDDADIDAHPLSQLPAHLWDFMQDALPCSFCGKPYIHANVVRHRIVQRLDDSLLPVRYRLCRAHWADENDRLLTLFSTSSA